MDSTVDDTKNIAENTKVTSVTPKMVRLQGKSRPGAPYRSWLAHFIRDQAPRPGFRLFDESGVAVVNKPRQLIQQCKRCHGFHATRGCSRALACENCGSTMHAITKCKAPTRCCNCGVPHRSDSRNCLVHPSRSGPVRKDQRKKIKKTGQREYHAEVMAKAAMIRAEAAAVVAELLPTIDQNNDRAVISTNEVSMSEVFIEETVPETRLQRGSTHDIALSRANEIDIDVKLIQESWWSNITKSYTAFDCHVPFGGANTRPRTITYTCRNNLKISANQNFPSSNPTGDYFWVIVNGVTFSNVYKAPNNTTSIQTFITWAPSPMTVAIGDSNSFHWTWQPGRRCKNLGWNSQSILSHNWRTYAPGREHTRSCLSNIPGTQVWVDHTECITSDHLPLRGTVSTPFLVICTLASPIRVTSSKIPKFTGTVAQWASPPPPLINTEDIEIYAQDLCTCLSNAIKTGSQVRVCIIGCGNKSPRAHGISIELLTACWKTIDPYVVQLFRDRVRLGFHSFCFKLAEVIFLRKYERDPSTVKAWRPSALLSCLGKGPERVIAKRMSYLAIVHGVVGSQQFGALSKRAATDFVSSVVHDIEEARSQR
ncbi:hypothetical protein EPUL_002569 [Erysiphe pulchra]|uniref:Endonuclease/exonuclease/phosphatase domain-containing protein n=1 Tax=Erysiphe pulchra TaxID=225359 RepID=A0A2S4PPX3_9PEZI|nr:hypothetical protein EPUL_002569 [Erysiphe pulchra]